MIRTQLMEHQRKVVNFACSENRKFVGIFSDYGIRLNYHEELGFSISGDTIGTHEHC